MGLINEWFLNGLTSLSVWIRKEEVGRDSIIPHFSVVHGKTLKSVGRLVYSPKFASQLRFPLVYSPKFASQLLFSLLCKHLMKLSRNFTAYIRIVNNNAWVGAKVVYCMTIPFLNYHVSCCIKRKWTGRHGQKLHNHARLYLEILLSGRDKNWVLKIFEGRRSKLVCLALQIQMPPFALFPP